jgi:glycosyltransferase involved in cell wall biosynthesis
MAKVFIGMPVYNGERFIKEALDSLLSQNFTDWKLSISDDSSTDRTGLICEEYAKRDIRITYHRQGKNMGMFSNFKFVLDNANSEYFMWMAQDDMRDKEYLSVCLKNFDSNSNLGLVTTVIAIIDSYGRTLIEESSIINLSGKPGLISVLRYILQPEILGKCNLMYGLWKTETLRQTWLAYPQRYTWGQDYMFSLALVSRFEIYIDPKVLFKKRLGGFSSPEALEKDNHKNVRTIEYRNPKNHMFPFKRFSSYFKGHREALRGTSYQPLAFLLILRLPRAFFIYLKERNFRKILRKIY